MRIVLLGPPGVGKGTQAKLVAQKHKLEKISTGDLLRAELANNTELGKLAQQYMRQGMLVPDDIVNKMVAEKIASLGSGAGFLLDGYPRTIAQAVALEAALRSLGVKIDRVIAFQSDENTLLERIRGRAKIENRTDDDEQTALNRFRIYQQETAPLIDHYKKSELLIEINASGDIETVNKLVEEALAG
jgi:adenylate kinase